VRYRFLVSTIASVALVVLVFSSMAVPVAGADAQEATAAAKAWDPPRTSDGRPDLQGLWTPSIGGHTYEEGPDPANARVQGDPQPDAGRPNVIVDPTPEGKIPYQPWAAEKKNEHLRNIFAPTKREHIEPEDRCLPNGVPRSNLRGQMQITQGPGYVLILYEWIHAYRFIPLDGKPHVAKNVRLWNGDSRGRWEGDTLVVDVTNFAVDAKNFNNQPWLDGHGSFYTDALHVVERWTLADANTIKYQATIEDPKVFTRPWTLAFTIGRNRDAKYEFYESTCYEGHNLELSIGAGRAAIAAGQTGIHEHTKGFYGGK
jgi:hypothetical protein